MPRQVVFPCPNCGASQSVDEGSVSTQCQFCGNTVQVPDELRPKTPPPAPAATPYSFGGAAGMPGMPAGLPGMFMNMDVTKLRAMAMAARAGDLDEAARLYSEAFGVPLEDAKQAAQLMATHHPLVLNQMLTQIESGSAPMMQTGGMPPVGPYARPGVTYNLPSRPMYGPNPPARRNRTCGVFFALLVLAVVLAFSLIIILPTILRVIGPSLGR